MNPGAWDCYDLADEYAWCREVAESLGGVSLALLDRWTGTWVDEGAEDEDGERVLAWRTRAVWEWDGVAYEEAGDRGGRRCRLHLIGPHGRITGDVYAAHPMIAEVVLVADVLGPVAPTDLLALASLYLGSGAASWAEGRRGPARV